MRIKTVAVMAGTLVDTRMGMEFLQRREPGLRTLYCPVSTSPREQHAFQLSSMEEKVAAIRAQIRDARSKGAEALLVYCNSLSGALDFPCVCAEEGMPVVTPLMVYHALGKQYDKIAAIAANNQSLYGIERSIFEVNPLCDVFGAALMPVVRAIEAEMPPDQLVTSFGLDRLMRFFEKNEVDCMVLGCTHFPYFLGALEQHTPLQIFNPDDGMYELLGAL